MRVFLCVIFSGLIFFFSCDTSYNQRYKNRPAARAVEDLLYKIEQSLEKKYNIQTIGTSIGMPNNVVGILGLRFQAQGPRSQEEIRSLLINLAQEFLIFVNNDEAIRPYLKNYPFEIKNLEVILFFTDSKGYPITNPYISNAQILQDVVTYSTIDPADRFKYKQEFEESHEEALKALKN